MGAAISISGDCRRLASIFVLIDLSGGAVRALVLDSAGMGSADRSGATTPSAMTTVDFVEAFDAGTGETLCVEPPLSLFTGVRGGRNMHAKAGREEA